MLKNHIFYLMVGLLLISWVVPLHSNSSISVPDTYPSAFSLQQTNTTTAPPTNTSSDQAVTSTQDTNTVAEPEVSGTNSVSIIQDTRLASGVTNSMDDFISQLLIVTYVAFGGIALYLSFKLFKKFIPPHFRVDPPTGGANYQKFST